MEVKPHFVGIWTRDDNSYMSFFCITVKKMELGSDTVLSLDGICEDRFGKAEVKGTINELYAKFTKNYLKGEASAEAAKKEICFDGKKIDSNIYDGKYYMLNGPSGHFLMTSYPQNSDTADILLIDFRKKLRHYLARVDKL